MFEAERQAAVSAVRAAARLCRRVRLDTAPDALQKGDRSPVTVADFGSQALVCRALALAFPDDPVVGEERADVLRAPENGTTAETVVHHVAHELGEAAREDVLGWIDRGGHREGGHRFWTLDPIDGTKGFLRGDQYAVALALVRDGVPVVAALACPNLGAEGALAWAVQGEGAWWTRLGPGIDSETSAGHAGAQEKPLRVSPEAQPARSRFCESVESGHSSHSDAARVAALLGIAGEPVRMDSQAKYLGVARGDAEIYLRLPTRPGYVEKIWDHAAGALVVQEAGGRITDVAGRPLDFGRGYRLEANRGVVATNGPLHDRLITALAEIGVA